MHQAAGGRFATRKLLAEVLSPTKIARTEARLRGRAEHGHAHRRAWGNFAYQRHAPAGNVLPQSSVTSRLKIPHAGIDLQVPPYPGRPGDGKTWPGAGGGCHRLQAKVPPWPSMLDHRNARCQSGHILTIEDPVEFMIQAQASQWSTSAKMGSDTQVHAESHSKTRCARPPT